MKKYLAFLLVSLLVACATPPAGTAPPDSQQQVINLTYQSYTALRGAIKAADAAVLAGKLKGQDAQNVLAGLTAAKAGLDATLASMPATAASGVTK